MATRGLEGNSQDALPPEHSALLAALQEQQARHEETVRNMLKEQLKLLSGKLGKLTAKRAGADERPEQPPKGEASDPESEEEAPANNASGFTPTHSVSVGAAASMRNHEDANKFFVTKDHRFEEGKAAQAAPAAVKAGGEAVQASPQKDELQRSQTHAEVATNKAFVMADERPETKRQSLFTMEQQAHTKCKKVARRIERSRLFQTVIEVMIFANGVMLGVQQDLLLKNLGEELHWTWLAIDTSFAAIFSIEIIVRITASGRRYFSMSNEDWRWNIFDLILVISALVEVTCKFTGANAVVDMSPGRILRMTRLVRVVRIVRVLRFFKDLRVMVLSIMGSMQPLAFAIALFLMLIYTVSTFLIHFVTEELIRLEDTYGRESEQFLALHKHYSSMTTTIYSLFMSISGGISWGEVAAPLWDISSLLGCGFVLYVSFSMFCVLNIITGIFVEEATSKTSSDEEHMIIRELEKRKKFISEAQRFFEDADEDGSGMLSWPEFEERLQNLRMQTLLEHLGIDVIACGAENVFQMFDFDGDGNIAVTEFTAGLHRLGGGARSIEIAGIRFDQGRLLQEVASMTESVREVLKCVKDGPATTKAPPSSIAV